MYAEKHLELQPRRPYPNRRQSLRVKSPFTSLRHTKTSSCKNGGPVPTIIHPAPSIPTATVVALLSNQILTPQRYRSLYWIMNWTTPLPVCVRPLVSRAPRCSNTLGYRCWRNQHSGTGRSGTQSDCWQRNLRSEASGLGLLSFVSRRGCLESKSSSPCYVTKIDFLSRTVHLMDKVPLSHLRAPTIHYVF